MAIIWPVTLPTTFGADNYVESPPDNTVRHDPDGGPSMARPLYTAAVRPLSGQMLMTKTQVATLDLFYSTYGGFTEFSFVHPRTGAAITCRLPKPPEYRTKGPLEWLVTIHLEILA